MTREYHTETLRECSHYEHTANYSFTQFQRLCEAALQVGPHIKTSFFAEIVATEGKGYEIIRATPDGSSTYKEDGIVSDGQVRVRVHISGNVPLLFYYFQLYEELEMDQLRDNRIKYPSKPDRSVLLMMQPISLAAD